MTTTKAFAVSEVSKLVIAALCPLSRCILIWSEPATAGSIRSRAGSSGLSIGTALLLAMVTNSQRKSFTDPKTLRRDFLNGAMKKGRKTLGGREIEIEIYCIGLRFEWPRWLKSPKALSNLALLVNFPLLGSTCQVHNIIAHYRPFDSSRLCAAVTFPSFLLPSLSLIPF